MPESEQAKRYRDWLNGGQVQGFNVTGVDALEARPEGVSESAQFFSHQNKGVWYDDSGPLAAVELKGDKEVIRPPDRPPAERAFIAAARAGAVQGIESLDSGVEATLGFAGVTDPIAVAGAQEAARATAIEGIAIGAGALAAKVSGGALAPAAYTSIRGALTAMLKAGAYAGVIGGGASAIFGGAQSAEETVMDAGAQLGGGLGHSTGQAMSMTQRAKIGKAALKVMPAALRPWAGMISALGKIPTTAWAGSVFGAAGGYSAAGGDAGSMLGALTWVAPGAFNLGNLRIANRATKQLGISGDSVEEIYGQLDTASGAGLRLQQIGREMSQQEYEARLGVLLDRSMLNRTDDLTKDDTFVASFYALTNDLTSQIKHNRAIDPRGAVESASAVAERQRLLMFPFEFGKQDVEELGLVAGFFQEQVSLTGKSAARSELTGALSGSKGKATQARAKEIISGKKGDQARQEMLEGLRKPKVTENHMLDEIIEATKGDDPVHSALKIDEIIAGARDNLESRHEYGQMLKAFEGLASNPEFADFVPEITKIGQRMKGSFVKNVLWDPKIYGKQRAGQNPGEISDLYFNGEQMLKYMRDNQESLKQVLGETDFQVTKDISRLMNFHQQAGYNIGSAERHAEQVTSFGVNRMIFMLTTGAWIPQGSNPAVKALIGTGVTKFGASPLIVSSSKLLEMGFRNPKANKEFVEATIKGDRMKSGKALRLLIRTTDPALAQKMDIATETEQEPESGPDYWDMIVPQGNSLFN